MKTVKRLIVFAIGLFWISSSLGQVGIGTNLPQKSSALEIKSGQRGLLIPRVELNKTDDKSPIVEGPANSLLIYNTAERNDVSPGFYYWHHQEGAGDYDGFWISIQTGKGQGNPGESVNDILVRGGGNMRVDSTQINGKTIYTVDLRPSGDIGQVLMTQTIDGDTTATWVDFKSMTDGANGLHTEIIGDSTVVKLGGELVQETTIETNGNDFLFRGLGKTTAPDSVLVKRGDTLRTIAANYFFRNTQVKNGLQQNGDTIYLGGDLSKYTEINTKNHNLRLILQEESAPDSIIVMDNQGNLRTISPDSLLSQSSNASNGLQMNGDTVQLGGPLTHATIITTTPEDTLSIKGLEEADTKNKIVVIKDNSGTLRTVTRSLNAEINSSYVIATELSGYSPFIQEITINVAITGLDANDIDLTLPEPAVAEGQVINVKLSGGSEADHYLNIIDSANNALSYGALPYQSWILKSNGSDWVVVTNN